jgi:hypothetical protein
MSFARHAMTLRGLVLLVVGLACTLPARAAGPSCAGHASCTETSSFVAMLSDFRTSVAGSDRVATATMRFQNKLGQPLILGYVTGSGVVTDDKGNRYLPGPDSVRGIGAVAGGNVDAKFILEPGEASDARFEFVWKASKATLGTAYQLDLTVQEFEALAGGQYKPGRERVLQFTNAGQKAATTVAPAAAAVGVPTDPCAGLPRCAGGGAFIAQVVSPHARGRPGRPASLTQTEPDIPQRQQPADHPGLQVQQQRGHRQSGQRLRVRPAGHPRHQLLGHWPRHLPGSRPIVFP